MSYNKAVVKWCVLRVLGFLNEQISLTYLNQLFDILLSHSLSVSVPIRAKISTPHPLPSRSRGKFFTSLRCRRNLTPASNVCEVAPISLFWASNRLNKLPEMRCEFPFNLIGKLTMGFFNRPIIAYTQFLVHRWEPRARVSVLFHRWTQPEV